MPSAVKSFNLTLDIKIMSLLRDLANKNQQTAVALIKELILEALDHREDLALSFLAKKRDLACQKRINHREISSLLNKTKN